MPWNPPTTAPKCPACQKSVYTAEQVMAADRKPYHKSCVKCIECNIPLNPRTLNEHDEELFCNVCYTNIFNPQVFTTSNYTGIVTPEDIARQKEKERLEKEKMERAMKDKHCPTCGNKVYPEQAIEISEVIFHRICVKCIECHRAFDGKDMILSPGECPKPYCKFCFAKEFGISALDITDLVQIAPSQEINASGL
uniref:Muscle LIM protein Mlp84B n=1 Tax=Caligus rogercresseyi TaxID=217165 RepID=C1BNF8_CALRO|nr:Muscle LIM protein Mlp84B [Caligus rogercresseyi]|eukprot:TRINITY_DN226_c0_g1_i1.p1 TRINITY_DN226_c0_g1~~TRINITY_DN226_c0_g1_i1.p1  ORF type:complete len:195 (+),score=45.89 TRINITY_DN226_c0_g1_i1:381-965(+)